MSVCWELENFLRQSYWLLKNELLELLIRPQAPPHRIAPLGRRGRFILRLTKGLERWFSD